MSRFTYRSLAAATVIVLLIALSACAANQNLVKEAVLSVDDFIISEDGIVSIALFPPEMTTENFAQFTGITYEEYEEEVYRLRPKLLSEGEFYDMVEGNEELSFCTFEGKTAFLQPMMSKEGTIRGVYIHFPKDGSTEAERAEFTTALLEKLRAAIPGTQEGSMFLGMPNGIVWNMYENTADGAMLITDIYLNYETK